MTPSTETDPSPLIIPFHRLFFVFAVEMMSFPRGRPRLSVLFGQDELPIYPSFQSAKFLLSSFKPVISLTSAYGPSIGFIPLV